MQVIKTLGTGGVALVSYGAFNSMSLPLLGVPLTVIAMAAAGAYLSFAYGKPEPSRRKMYGLAITNTFLACVTVAVIPAAFDWQWVGTKLEAPLAAIAAFVARWWIPAFIESVPEWIRRILKLGEYKDVGSDKNSRDSRNSRDSEPPRKR